MDYAASPPVCLSAFNSFQIDVASNLYSNPHSRSPSSIRTTQRIDAVRSRVMRTLFNISVEQEKYWDLIFTSGATAGSKLLAEAFPWSSESAFRYHKEVHTSVVGMRDVAAAEGASVSAMNRSQIQIWLDTENHESNIPSLFIYATQCNATGRRTPLDYCQQAKRLSSNQFVGIDAAAHLSTSVLDLSDLSLGEAPDYVSFSFYKIFVSVDCATVSFKS